MTNEHTEASMTQELRRLIDVVQREAENDGYKDRPMSDNTHEAKTMLQSAIEALQGEVERLKDINRDALSNLNELCDAKNAEIAALAAELAAVRAVRDQLDKSWHDIARTAQLEAEALQAKLDELQRQEPVAWMRKDGKHIVLASNLHMYADGAERHPFPLYAAPKALEPLTDDAIWKNDALMSANSGYGATFETLREIIRAVEAAHGITKGTP